MRMGKPYDLVFTTKIVAVLTFLFTGRKKSVFLYTFVILELGLGMLFLKLLDKLLLLLYILYCLDTLFRENNKLLFLAYYYCYPYSSQLLLELESHCGEI